MMCLSEKEEREIRRACDDSGISWESLQGRNIVITGATGLIGGALAKSLLYYASQKGVAMHLYLPVRNKEKAIKIYKGWNSSMLHIESEQSFTPGKWPFAVDYIFHAAAPTDSMQFIQQPVEVIEAIYDGIRNLMQVAKEKKASSVLFLSTMEVYGNPVSSDIKECDFGGLNPCSVRASYPESKRMAECMCSAYAAEYGVPVKIARLTQTFGYGVDVNTDQRVFAQFARAAINGHDIILHTKGQTERCYIDVMDAVRACLYILLKGENGEAYNVANPETYCSIYEMATMVASEYGICVRIEPSAELAAKYCPTQKVPLNVDKLHSLGWHPTVGLNHSFSQLIS